MEKRNPANAAVMILVFLIVPAARADHVCVPNFQTSGASKGSNGDYIVHVVANSHIDHDIGCGEGVSYSCPLCPNDVSLTGYNASGFPCGNDCVADVNVSCWSPGTYTVTWTAGCGWYYPSLGVCEVFPNSQTPCEQRDPQCSHTTTTFTVPPRDPIVSAEYDEAQHRLKIMYSYDIGSFGQLQLYKNGNDDDAHPDVNLNGNPDCNHPSGVCYQAVTPPPCGNTDNYVVKVRACSNDAWTQTQATVGCPVGDYSPCKPNNDLKNSCPISPNNCSGLPVNTATGDVSATVPLFDISQAPLPIHFEITYHSMPQEYPGAVLTPMGNGWTHTFNASLRPADPQNMPGRLLLHTSHGERYEWDQYSSSIWLAAKPYGAQEVIVTSGSEHVLRFLDGSEMHFDIATGHWNSTRDRWGNAVSGAYNGSGELATVTDSMGRTLTFAYAAGLLASVTLPGGESWHFAYGNGNLTSMIDPVRPDAWRTFTYIDDSHGVNRLLSDVLDAGNVVLEHHDYDTQDRGTSSVAAGGRDSYVIQYDTPAIGQTRVTHQVDASASSVTTFSIARIHGLYYPTEVDGVCPSCGASSDTQTFSYDPRGQVVSRVDGSGHTFAYTYDSFGNLRSQRDAVGSPEERTVTYEYDYAPATHPAWPSFLTKKIEASAAGSGSRTTEYSWSADEKILTTTETGTLASGGTPVSYVTTHTYDEAHRLKTIDGPRDVNDVTVYAYYPDTDATISRRGRLQSITDGLNHITTFDDYDLFGTPKSITDPNGVVTKRETDARGRTTSITNKAVPADSNEGMDYVFTRTYDARDRLTQTASARGFITRYAYEDGTNLLTDTTLVDGNGNEQERRHVAYDLSGQKTTEEDEACATPATTCAQWTAQKRETYVYNTLGRLTEVHHGDDVIVYGYDADGFLRSVEDENHTATDVNHSTPNTTYGYDALHRLKTVTQKWPLASNGTIVTTYGYDIQDNLNRVTDPNGNVTSYQYDDFHRMRQQVSPVTGTTSYGYDAGGNLIDVTDANNAHTSRTYDEIGRVTTATSTNGSASENVTWTYDTAAHYGIGRLATMTDPTGTTTYDYERRGLLRSEQKTYLSGGATYTTSYGYDENGNRTVMNYPTSATFALVRWAFDYADRPLSVAAPGYYFPVTSATYKPFGPMATMTYGNGFTKTMEYDTRYRLTRNKLADANGGAVADYNYTYDGSGNITHINDTQDTTFDRDFGYDDLNRLTTANTGFGLWQVGSYSYDAMGNLLSRSLGAPSPDTGLSLPGKPRASVSAVSGYVDRLIFTYQGTTPKIASVTTVNAPPDNGGLLSAPKKQRPFTTMANELSHPVGYDSAGNETHYFADRAYSPRNLMSSVNDDKEPGSPDATHKVDYGYDGRGLRVMRTESPAPNGPATRHYFYSPELQLIDITVDDSPNFWSRRSTTLSAPLETDHAFLWFNGQPVAEIGPYRTPDPGQLSTRRPATPLAVDVFLYTFTDHLGTPLMQFNHAGDVQWRAEYEPYGNVYLMRAGAPKDQPLRFPGQDVATTWEGGEENYNIFRWYRAGWGRYTQSDPIGLSGGIDLYVYARTNPITFKDPFGAAAVDYIGLPNESIQKKCGQTALGCATGDISGKCGCKCSGGGFRATPWLSVGNWKVYFSTDCYDTGKIIMEEEKHIPAFEKGLEDANQLGVDLKKKVFPTIQACEFACDVWKVQAASDIQNFWKNYLIDFFHPWKKCNGQWNWQK